VEEGLLSIERNPEQIEYPKELSDESFVILDDIRILYSQGKYLDAVDLLVASSMENPQFQFMPAFSLLEAELYFMLGLNNLKIQFEVAKERYEDLLYTHPDSVNEPLILFRLSTILKRQGFIPEATGTYQLLMEKHPDSLFAHNGKLGLASCYYSQAGYEEAKVLIDKVKTDPRSKSFIPYALILEAKIAYRNKNVPLTFKLFEKATMMGVKPEELTPEVLFIYAETLFDMGQKERGYDLHQKLISMENVGEYITGALLRMADYEIEINEVKSAILRYKSLLKKYPESEPGYLAAIRLGDLRANKFPYSLDPQVIEVYNKVVKSLAPNSISNLARLRLASYYLAGENFSRSIELGSDILRSSPKSKVKRGGKKIIIESFEKLLEAGAGAGRYEEICKVFKENSSQIISAKPGKELIEMIFKAHHELLLYDSIIQMAEMKYVKTRFTTMARLYAGKAYLRKGEKSEGARLLVWVANSDKSPERIFALLELAKIRRKNGDINGTISTLKMVLKIKEIDPVVYADTCVRLGRRYVEVAEYKMSEKWFTEAVKIIDPERGVGNPPLLADAIFALADLSYRKKNHLLATKLYKAAVGGFSNDIRKPLALFRLGKMSKIPAKENPDDLEIDSYWKWLLERMDSQIEWAKTNPPLKG